MRSRSLRSGFGVGLLCLVLLAAGCGDSGDDDDSSGSGDESTETTDASRTLEQVDCGQLEYDADAPSGGTFTDYAQLSSAGDNTSFDPGVVQTLDEAQITTAMWDGLTDFDFTEKCAPELKGAVAESWESNEDATEWTFQLKDGLTFCNGDPVLPSSFELAWNRAASPALESPYGYVMAYIDGGAEVLDGSAEEISGIEADDEALTLTVTMDAPNADFPSIVVHSTFMPITTQDAEAFSDGPPGWGDAGATIGNGPFMMESASEEEVVLVPNPEWAGNVYGDTEVKLDEIVFKTTIDVESAYTTFAAGQGESGPVPPTKFAEADESYPNNTLDDPAMGTYFFDFGADSVLGGDENVKLRQAISLAINREEINDKVYEGYRTISTGITPPGVPGFTEDICEYCELRPRAGEDAVRRVGGRGRHPRRHRVPQLQRGRRSLRRGPDHPGQPRGDPGHRVRARPGRGGLLPGDRRRGWLRDLPLGLVRRLPDLRQLHGRPLRSRLDRGQQPRSLRQRGVRDPDRRRLGRDRRREARRAVRRVGVAAPQRRDCTPSRSTGTWVTRCSATPS